MLQPLKCATLRDACLRLDDPQPTCSSTCERRAFRMDVYGPHADVDVRTALRDLSDLRDPLRTQLRHLELDIFARSSWEPRPPLPWRAESHHMLWPPHWENGFSEVIMWTLLPLGYLLSHSELLIWHREIGEMAAAAFR